MTCLVTIVEHLASSACFDFEIWIFCCVGDGEAVVTNDVLEMIVHLRGQ